MTTRYLLWILLAMPGIPLLVDFIYDERYYSELMYESGLLSVQLFVLTLCLTPFRLLTQGISQLRSLNRWLMANRRYFGVASFGYAVIHLGVYLREYPDVSDILSQTLQSEIALGWAAMLLMTLLAITSNNASVKRLGPQWKMLHRWAYPTAILLYLHWYLVGFFLQNLHYWFVPLAVFQLYRVSKQLLRQRKINAIVPHS